MIKFLNKLKGLGRFSDSLIIIHGDHGDKFKQTNGRLEKINYRSHRALLLVKAGKIDGLSPLRISRHEVSLLDIASIIREFAGSERPGSAVGHSVLAPDYDKAGNANREYFIVHGDKAMTRNLVQGSELVSMERIPIPNIENSSVYLDSIPLVPVNTIVEAESGKPSESARVANHLPGVKGRYVHGGDIAFRFILERDASVYVSARLITPSGNNDSSFLRIDDKKSDKWGMRINKTWQWQDSPTVWELEKGAHVLTIEYREPVYLDQLKINVKYVDQS